MANRAARQLKGDMEAGAKERLAKELRRGKIRHKKNIDLIRHLCAAPVVGDIVYRVNFKHPEDNESYNDLSPDSSSFVSAFKKSTRSDKEKFWDFISLIEEKSTLIESTSVYLFWHLFSYDIFWQQDLKNWTARSSNDDKQFFSLVNHIFAKFPLPKFALKIWRNTSPPNAHVNWFLHLAEGKNIRSADNLPFSLSPKMAHAFLSAPEDYSFEKAFLYGQLLSFGADKRLISELCDNLRTEDLRENEFWTSFYKLLVANPIFDLVHVQPLRDFIVHKRRENANYSLKGRNLQTLLTQMEEWHRELTRLRVEREREAARQRNQNRAAGRPYAPYVAPKPVSYKWKASFPQVFEYKEGKVTWQIYELTSSEALSEDGSEMRHCVGSYASSCHAKRISILSLTCAGKKTATLEVALSSSKMMQARGKCNRRLGEKEQRIVTQWCSKNAVSPGGF